ncbi:MAG: epoxyqueuosine reductase QueH [Bacillota bacterium]|nr:epoxyqueuosine reductase QueH [Bacillota bacterium]
MKLLMHMCCAPCSVYPVEVLKKEGVEIQGLYYNPNIHPKEEFLRRKENVEKFSALKEIPVSYFDDFKQEVWESFKGQEVERCTMCYSIRLDKAAAFARENGYDAFTTSLLVSPYQKHELIKDIGEKAALKHGVSFYYRDFRPGFRQGQQMAKEMGLYRQKFCGCIVSYNESPFTKK